jgi:chemotaxis protein methyltransferase CheR
VSEVAQLTEAEFVRFQHLIEEEVGIHLPDSKQPLLIARLSRRLRQLNMTSFGQYYDHVVAGGDPHERTRMYDAISTNETRFFREPKQFELLTNEILPKWKALAAVRERERRVRVWSVGCSTGEEPYSLAMILLDVLGDDWDIRIDATDISTRVLDTARQGVWPMRKATEIPESYRCRFMLRGTRSQEGFFQAGDAVRSVIRFGRLNLAETSYPMPDDYDLVFCRNVLIYFSSARRIGVVRSLLSHLVDGGYFFLGHAETLSGIAHGPRTVLPTVYVK